MLLDLIHKLMLKLVYQCPNSQSLIEKIIVRPFDAVFCLVLHRAYKLCNRSQYAELYSTLTHRYTIKINCNFSINNIVL